MMKHELKREYTGSNEMRTITPTCSCGWHGDGVPAWNDFQHTAVKNQEADHIRETKER